MPESLKKLINLISMLPGIWEKSASKLAFFMLNANPNYLENISKSIKDINSQIWKCSICRWLVDKSSDKCNICLDKSRDQNTICVVEEYLDMISLETSWIYKWKYHILWWAISPINWVFIWDLDFENLFDRIKNTKEKLEIIIATNPNIEWEATSAYIKEEIEKRWLKTNTIITKLSRWLSSGYIEYADNISIINSIKDRKEI